MGDKPQKITTSADLLMNLLRDSKEISIDEAAKVLGIPVATLETWATFLEEEKQIQIKYKLTTPYLVYGSGETKVKELPKEIFEPKLVPDDAEDSTEKTNELVFKAESDTKKGDFASARQAISSLIGNTRLLEGIAQLDVERKSLIDRQIGNVEAALKRANGFIDSGKFDLGSRIYQDLQKELKDIILVLRKQAVQKKEKDAYPSDAKQLLERAYLLLKEGKLEEAKESYEALRGLYKSLPKEFAVKKLDLERNIVKLNKDLSLAMERLSIELMNKGTKRINEMIASAKDASNKGDFALAEEVYYEIKNSFDSLPEGFVHEHRALEKNILSLFESISLKRKDLLTRALNDKLNAISSLLILIDGNIKAGKIDDAIKNYNEAKKAFDSLPNEFISEKVKIQEKMIPLYTAISAMYSSHASSEISKGIRQVNLLIAEMKSKVDSGDIGGSEKVYEQMKVVFRSLPEGYVKEKIDLQNSIIEIYEYMLSKSESSKSTLLKSRLLELGKLVNEGLNYARSGKHELAEELYNNAVKVYNQLPSGFIYEKSIVRQSILNLYRELTLNIDMHILMKTSTETNEKYREILRILIQSRHNLEEKKFELLEQDYHSIRKLFNELPLGFVQENLKLRESIVNLAKLVDFYRKITAVGEGKDSGIVLSELYKLRDSLAVPENQPLIQYFEEVVSKKHAKEPLPIPSPPPAPLPANQQSPIQAQQSFGELKELHEKIAKLRVMASPVVRVPV